MKVAGSRLLIRGFVEGLVVDLGGGGALVSRFRGRGFLGFRVKVQGLILDSEGLRCLRVLELRV